MESGAFIEKKETVINVNPEHTPDAPDMSRSEVRGRDFICTMLLLKILSSPHDDVVS
jgi:hypothetical protein